MFLEKTKTAKEEARELQLNEEGRIREKVMSIQHNLSLMLKALGEMAIANPIFTHSQLPSSVSSHFFINLLLSAHLLIFLLFSTYDLPRYRYAVLKKILVCVFASVVRL